MNTNELKMLDILKELKNDCGVIGIKSEFEAEGIRLTEMIALNEIIHRADSEVYLKIGGCEAVSDLEMSKIYGAKGIIAPMIESDFALSKFIHSFEKVYGTSQIRDRELFINMETKQSFENFDVILGSPFAKPLEGVVIGRVDLSASYGLGRKNIDEEFLFGICKTTLEKVKEHDKIAGMGGAVAMSTIPLLERLGSLIDRVETRKVIFDVSNGTQGIRKGLKKAIEFEYYFMLNLAAIYGAMSKENEDRMYMLKDRIEKFND